MPSHHFEYQVGHRWVKVREGDPSVKVRCEHVRMHLRFRKNDGRNTSNYPATFDTGSHFTTVPESFLLRNDVRYEKTGEYVEVGTASGGRKVVRELVYLKVALSREDRNSVGEFFDLLCLLWPKEHGQMKRALVSLCDVRAFYTMHFADKKDKEREPRERRSVIPGALELRQREGEYHTFHQDDRREAFDRLMSP